MYMMENVQGVALRWPDCTFLTTLFIRTGLEISLALDLYKSPKIDIDS